MRDAFGGLLNIVIIVVFMTLVSGYLAFNVSYAKAFKVKNKIISTIENYNGSCDFNNAENTCYKDVLNYEKTIGYQANVNMSQASICSKSSTEGYTDCKCNQALGFCWLESQKKVIDGIDSTITSIEYKSFRIVTQVYIDLPIINRLLPNLSIFQVTGDTKDIPMNIKTKTN